MLINGADTNSFLHMIFPVLNKCMTEKKCVLDKANEDIYKMMLKVIRAMQNLKESKLNMLMVQDGWK